MGARGVREGVRDQRGLGVTPPSFPTKRKRLTKHTGGLGRTRAVRILRNAQAEPASQATRGNPDSSEFDALQGQMGSAHNVVCFHTLTMSGPQRKTAPGHQRCRCLMVRTKCARVAFRSRTTAFRLTIWKSLLGVRAL